MSQPKPYIPVETNASNTSYTLAGGRVYGNNNKSESYDSESENDSRPRIVGLGKNKAVKFTN